MREIKFRYWNGVINQMVNNPPMPHKEGWTIIQLFSERGWVWIQYTGLKDRSGKDIYEGDIVNIANYQEDWKRGEPSFDWRFFEVMHNKYVYAFENSVIYTPFSHYSGKTLEEYVIDVIGNIYENPELLQSNE